MAPRTVRPNWTTLGSEEWRVITAFTKPGPPSSVTSCTHLVFSRYLLRPSSAAVCNSALPPCLAMAAFVSCTERTWEYWAFFWTSCGQPMPLARARTPFVCSTSSSTCFCIAASMRSMPPTSAKATSPVHRLPTRLDSASMPASCVTPSSRQRSISAAAAPIAPASTRGCGSAGQAHSGTESCFARESQPAAAAGPHCPPELTKALATGTTSTTSFSTSCAISRGTACCQRVLPPLAAVKSALSPPKLGTGGASPSESACEAATTRATASLAFTARSVLEDMASRNTAMTEGSDSLFRATDWLYAMLQSALIAANPTTFSPGWMASTRMICSRVPVESPTCASA
mmetsp:Transcript_67371/g.196962  ORF Transcript_67371/g.196962 Transcript_67371/m.196962 type:complete len:344 (-) Transcript_67371:193-1224(-)